MGEKTAGTSPEPPACALRRQASPTTRDFTAEVAENAEKGEDSGQRRLPRGSAPEDS